MPVSIPAVSETTEAVDGRELAAQLAARIPIPTQLPVRCDGERLEHLSHSSQALFVACPDAWRRRYLRRERSPQSGGMFLGSRVDDGLSDYYRHMLEHGERLPLAEVIQRYRAGWREKLEAEREHRGVVFDEFEEPMMLKLGAEALKVAFEQLVPQLGSPVAVQRRVEFRLAPGLEWTIVAYFDLETEWPELGGEQLVSEIVDYKVKGGDAIGQGKADRDPQASLYLAGRWLEGRPADRFAFAQALRPGRKRKSTSTSLVRTERTVGQMRATLARIALAASQIDAYNERYGAHRPWGYADPTSWKCSERYCEFWASCAGGAGL